MGEPHGKTWEIAGWTLPDWQGDSAENGCLRRGILSLRDKTVAIGVAIGEQVANTGCG
jgi:hypothetical protein